MCFYPGTLALAVKEGVFGNPRTSPEAKHHLSIAQELTKTCFLTYNQTFTGLAPEITHFNTMVCIAHVSVD